jgi:hypothetical protein
MQKLHRAFCILTFDEERIFAVNRNEAIAAHGHPLMQSFCLIRAIA